MNGKCKTGYVGCLLALAALNSPVSSSATVTLPEGTDTLQARLVRLSQALEARKTVLREHYQQQSTLGSQEMGDRLAFWGDFGDAPLWADFSDVGGILPGFGDFSDEPFWGDWGDLG